MVEWLSLGIAGAALLVAALSRLDSRKANRIAQEANEKSAAANEIAVEANRIAVEGNQLAVEANRIAVDGNKLAEEANLMARETALVAVEREHVLWNLTWEGEGALTLKNVGEDPAHDVLALVEVGDYEARGSEAVVSPGAGIALRFDGLAKKCIRDVREVSEARARQRRNPLAGGFCLEITWTLVLRVKWVSSLGKPGSYEMKKGYSSSDVLGL